MSTSHKTKALKSNKPLNNVLVPLDQTLPCVWGWGDGRAFVGSFEWSRGSDHWWTESCSFKFHWGGVSEGRWSWGLSCSPDWTRGSCRGQGGLWRRVRWGRWGWGAVWCYGCQRGQTQTGAVLIHLMGWDIGYAERKEVWERGKKKKSILIWLSCHSVFTAQLFYLKTYDDKKQDKWMVSIDDRWIVNPAGERKNERINVI